MITSLNLILEAQLVGKTLKEAGNKGCNEQGSLIEGAWITMEQVGIVDDTDPILRLSLRTTTGNQIWISLDPNDTFILED